MSARAIGTGLCVLAASVSLCAAQGLTLDELREQRSALAHQPRRIIANNDGCDVLYFPGDAELTTESFLAQRTTALAGKHVTPLPTARSARDSATSRTTPRSARS